MYIYVCVFVCVCVCVCVYCVCIYHVCVCLTADHACGFQKTTLDIVLHLLPFLSQGLFGSCLCVHPKVSVP